LPPEASVCRCFGYRSPGNFSGSLEGATKKAREKTEFQMGIFISIWNFLAIQSLSWHRQKEKR
jgi:hypothetical protein